METNFNTMGISLIANSGIQFHSFEVEINPNKDVISPIGFYECLNDKFLMAVEYAYYLPNNGVWVSKKALSNEGYLDEKNNIKDEFSVNINTLTPLRGNIDYYIEGDIDDALEYYENKWLPLPFFKKKESGDFSFGPTTWVRVLLKNITPKENKKTKLYKVVLAFDTNFAKENKDYYTPKYSDIDSGSNFFALCDNEDHNLNFCNKDFGCDWVENYLITQYYANSEAPETFPVSRHFGTYLYLVQYLAALKVFPEVILYSDKEKAVDVDLVLDIGNSNTCGLLFENPLDNKPFEFDKVQKLELKDLSLEFKDFSKSQSTSYNDPFDMRLAFVKADFGAIINNRYKKSFEWPSLVRVGKEAKRLINLNKINPPTRQEETATNNSSPKRYLWDDKPAKIPWEFINIPRPKHKDDETLNTYQSRFGTQVYYQGISNQFSGDGEYTDPKTSGVVPKYSRKSLMTFVFIEIYLHALSQINSYDFRDYHGNVKKPRKLRRITITCPTSIVQEEQVILRQCAVDAAKAILHFYTNNYDINRESGAEIEFEIIPSPQDLAKTLEVKKTKDYWIYDEATCCQLVYIYGEIGKRYIGDSELFFDLHGKKRDYDFDGDQEHLGEKSLVVGSIDIGGGTTDLMICSYHYTKDHASAVIEPRPLFWDSFNFAGDDLLQNLVQQIVLETPSSDLNEEGFVGVIESYARQCGCENATTKMLNFFASNKKTQSHRQKLWRKNFVVQVAIPIALRYLEHARQEKPDEIVGFDDIFNETPPNKELVEFFNEFFQKDCDKKFRVQDIKWKLSKDRVFEIVETTFAPLLKQLSILLSAHDCDVVLLAGKPTTLSKFRELIIRFYPVSPDKIISLNNYRVGRWYPSENERGWFDDPKIIVAVGALVGLMGERNKLEGFRLETKYLKTELGSTCNYIGPLVPKRSDIKIEYLTIDLNKNEVSVNKIPHLIGYKQISNKQYLGRPIYLLEFNTEEIIKMVKINKPELEKVSEIESEAKRYKKAFEGRMPFKVSLKRTMSKSKEDISIVSIKDNKRQPLSPNFLKLSLKTLSGDSYWLDQGIFDLSLKN